MANLKSGFGRLLRKPIFYSHSNSPIFSQTRRLHEFIPIPDELKSSCTLYPNTSLRLIETEMKMLTDKLNHLTRGTVYEYDTLYKTVIRSAPEPYDSVIFNTASQLWNLGFFVQQLSHKPVPLKNNLQELISRNFGSMHNFHRQMIAFATSLFGNGWTWVVEDDEGKLRLCNTMNAGTPLFPGRMQQTEGCNYGQGLVLQRQNKKMLMGDKEPGAYIPILALNMWHSGFISDHGNNIESYVTYFLNSVDWDRIYSRAIRKAI